MADGRSPIASRGNTFVVPDIDLMLVEPCDFRIYNVLIIVCVTHEQILLSTLIGGKRFIQRKLPERSQRISIPGYYVK